MERKSNQLIDSQMLESLPRKGQVCQLGEYKNSVFNSTRFLNQTLVCPLETRKLIKGIESSDEEIKNSFIRSCLLYQLAGNIGRYHPTVQIAYECASVEAIVKSNVKEYISFSDFMLKYAGDNKELYDVIYSKIRSAHWHSGEFSLGDFNFSNEFILNPSKHVTFKVIRLAHEQMRKAILFWLKEKIQLEPETEINS